MLIIYFAFADIAQSTNLLSFSSSFISPHWKKISVRITFSLFKSNSTTFTATIVFVFRSKTSRYSDRISLLMASSNFLLSRASKIGLYFYFVEIEINNTLVSTTTRIAGFILSLGVHSPTRALFHPTSFSHPKVYPFPLLLCQQNTEKVVLLSPSADLL